MLIKNVVLSFPSIFEKYVNHKTGKVGKYQASLLLDKKDTETYKMLDEAIEKCKAENNGVIKNKVIPQDKTFLIDGDTTPYPEEDGMWVIKAKNARFIPKTFNSDRSRIPVPEVKKDQYGNVIRKDHELLYPGAIVNAQVSTWFSKHDEGGMMVLLNFEGVQFVKHGEKLGKIAANEFEDLTGGDDNEFEDVSNKKDKDKYEDVPF